MYIAFNKDDFRSETRWFEFLGKIKVPIHVVHEISSVTIRTHWASVSEKIGDSINTTIINPDKDIDGC